MIQEQIQDYYASWLGINGLYDRWAKNKGMNTDQLFTLYTIWTEEAFCSQKMICDMWQIPKQTVNSILKKLEARNLVYLEPSGKDKRNKNIRFTGEGKAFADRLLGELQEMEAGVMARMGEKDCACFLDMNRKFMECLRLEIGGEEA